MADFDQFVTSGELADLADRVNRVGGNFQSGKGKDTFAEFGRVLGVHINADRPFWKKNEKNDLFKVQNISKCYLDSILSPTPSVKIQIMGRRVCLRCRGKTLLGVVNKLLKTKSLLTSPNDIISSKLSRQ